MVFHGRCCKCLSLYFLIHSNKCVLNDRSSCMDHDGADFLKIGLSSAVMQCQPIGSNPNIVLLFLQEINACTRIILFQAATFLCQLVLRKAAKKMENVILRKVLNDSLTKINKAAFWVLETNYFCFILESFEMWFIPSNHKQTCVQRECDIYLVERFQSSPCVVRTKRTKL